MPILEGISSTWFYILGIIAIVFVVIKIATKKQEYAVKLTWMLFLFFTLTIGYSYIQSNPDVTTVKGFFGFVKSYFSWVLSLFDNLRELTTNAINLDWNTNQTNNG